MSDFTNTSKEHYHTSIAPYYTSERALLLRPPSYFKRAQSHVKCPDHASKETYSTSKEPYYTSTSPYHTSERALLHGLLFEPASAAGVMYIYVCTYMYLCVYMYIYIYAYTYAYTYTCMCMYMYMYIYIYTHVNMCVCVCVQVWCTVPSIPLPRKCSSKICRWAYATATHCTARQHTATHGGKLQHTATHCNTLQHTATLWLHPLSSKCSIKCTCVVSECCSVLQCVAMGCSVLASLSSERSINCVRVVRIRDYNTAQHTATYCITLQPIDTWPQHSTTHCNILQYTATHRYVTATQHNTLQHTSTHCNPPVGIPVKQVQHQLCLCGENTPLQHTATLWLVPLSRKCSINCVCAVEIPHRSTPQHTAAL